MMGFGPNPLALIITASVAGIFSGLIVLLGEVVIEDIVKIGMLLILTGILWATTPKLGFIFISACISCGTGMILNQANKCAASQPVHRTPKSGAGDLWR